VKEVKTNLYLIDLSVRALTSDDILIKNGLLRSEVDLYIDNIKITADLESLKVLHYKISDYLKEDKAGV